ncbi:type IV secretory system conjugative DNA transfer family protein [Anaerovoracaceae bacterium 42-11]
MSNTQGPFQRMLKERKENQMMRGGKQKLIDYSRRQKIIFLLLYLVIWFFIVKLYNSYTVLRDGLFTMQEHETNPFLIFRDAITEEPIAAIIILSLSYIGAKFAMQFVSKSAKKDPRGFKTVENGAEGSSQMLDEEEKRKIYQLLDYDCPDGIILGKDKKTGELITIPWEHPDPDYKPTNFNIALFGPPGTRKTSGVLLGNIYNFLKAGLSVVVFDPKGEIYRETIAAAKYLNYNTKILNLLKGQFRHSDGWDVLKMIRESQSPQDEADLVATIIMENTGKITGDTFWYSANINCLKFCLLFVAKGVGFIPSFPPNSKGETRTIREVYHLITSQDMETKIQAAIAANKEDDLLLSQAFNIWRNHREADSIKSGLGMRLSILQNPDLVKVLSEDEIEFRELNDKPSIFYVICSDKDSTYKTILTLFTSFLFNVMTDIADGIGEDGLDRRLMLVFEEMANIGKIPELEKKVATLRSRNIGMIFCYQNIGQIMDTYGEVVEGKHKYETILGGCATQLCLSANDPTGQKYFSEQTGKMTIINESTSQNVGTFLPEAMKVSSTEKVSKMQRGRPVMMPDEIKKIKVKEILIIPSNYDVTLEEKYYFKDHPMYNIRMVDNKGKVVSCRPSMHTPRWSIHEMFIENREIMQGSPMTARDMLEDKYHPTYIENYGKKAKVSDMELPLYLRLLSLFFEIEEEDDEEPTEIPRQISQNDYASFIQKPEVEISEDAIPVSKSWECDVPPAAKEKPEVKKVVSKESDDFYEPPSPAQSLQEIEEPAWEPQDTTSEDDFDFTDAIFQDIDNF